MPLLIHQGKQEHQDSVNKLLREILILREKLQNTDDQSFYFKKGMEYNQNRLKRLEAEYEDIREILSNNSIDDFNEKINQLQLTLIEN